VTGFIDVAGPLNAVVYVPRQPVREGLPAVLFLHGRGECGTDGRRQLTHGPAKDAIEHPERWPALVVMPQKPDFDAPWSHFRSELNDLLGLVDARWRPGSHRAISGLSQGGRGALELGGRLDWRFDRVAAICGWVEDDSALPLLEGKNVWLFHGDQDTVVPPSGSLEVAARLRELGGEPRVTIFEGVGHDAWTPAFADGSLAAWLAADYPANLAR